MLYVFHFGFLSGHDLFTFLDWKNWLWFYKSPLMTKIGCVFDLQYSLLKLREEIQRKQWNTVSLTRAGLSESWVISMGLLDFRFVLIVNHASLQNHSSVSLNSLSLWFSNHFCEDILDHFLINLFKPKTWINISLFIYYRYFFKALFTVNCNASIANKRL